MTQAPGRILFVSGYFPPRAPMGAVRAGKLEQHWWKCGRDVRTIAIDFPGGGGGDTRPFVLYVPTKAPGLLTRKRRSFMRAAIIGGASSHLAGKSELASSSSAPLDADATASQGKAGLIELYRELLFFPDRYRSWIAPAIRCGKSIAETWTPDLVYSSGPPHASHMVAAWLSMHLHVPWVAELRDLWVDNPYEEHHPWLRPLHDLLGKVTLARAAGFVVVTNAASHSIESMANAPVVIAYNGYDPEDFEGLDDVEPFDRERLTIAHAGTIYAGRRDPTPLFEAIAALEDKRRHIRCLFYHDSWDRVAALARRHGVSESVEIRTAVTRSDMLRIEREVDVLLECHWSDPAGDGVIPGKLFEYIGARRPVLSLGSLSAEAAQIVRENHLGLTSNNPSEIKEWLLLRIEDKARYGRLPDITLPVGEGFRRETQFRKIDGLLDAIVQGRASNVDRRGATTS